MRSISKTKYTRMGKTDVRTTDEGHYVAIDVMRALEMEDPAASWRNWKAAHSDEIRVYGEFSIYSDGSPGRPPEAISPTMAKRLAMSVSGSKGTEIRNNILTVLEKVDAGDACLAGDMLAKSKQDPKLVRWHARRGESAAATGQLNAMLAERGIGRNMFPILTDKINQTVRGSTAAEIRLVHGVDSSVSSRDFADDFAHSSLVWVMDVMMAQLGTPEDVHGVAQVIEMYNDTLPGIAGIIKDAREKMDPTKIIESPDVAAYRLPESSEGSIQDLFSTVGEDKE